VAAPFSLSGRVVSSTSGLGIADALLVFADLRGASETRSAADGTFAWSTSLAGSYQLAAMNAKGYVSFAPQLGHSPVVVYARLGARVTGISLFLTPGTDPIEGLGAFDGGVGGALEIRGTVVDPAGKAVPGALIVVGGDVALRRVLSDDEGRFTIGELTAGAYELRASHPDFTPADAHAVSAGRRELTLQLGSGGKIIGVAHEAESGKPIAAFTVIARLKKGAIERGVEKHASFFDVDGSYELPGVQPGTQCLSAIAVGRGATKERCIELSQGGEVRVDFELERGARLAGRVIDRESRAALVGARVSLEQPFGNDEDLPLPVVASAETDAQGRFELGGLDTGVRSIFVTAAAHHSRVIPGLKLEPDRAAPPIEIDLLATKPGEARRIESAGINAVVSANGDMLVLGALTPGGGADRAGLQPGDIIVRVDGVELSSLGMQAGVEHLRGPEGSTVMVSIRRPPSDALVDVIVTRRRVVNL